MESLEVVEAKLKASGMRDVKFLFKREAVAVSKTDLEEDLADVLSKFHAGNYQVVDMLPSEELTQ